MRRNAERVGESMKEELSTSRNEKS